MNNEMLRNKRLYKIFMYIIRYVPLILSIISFTATLFNFLGIGSLFLSYLGGASILFILILFLIAEIFKFCWMYKVPLWYLTVVVILNMLRVFGYLPIDLMDLYRLYAFISGIFMVVFIGYSYKNRNNPNNKIDYIKNLCERYGCSCSI